MSDDVIEVCFITCKYLSKRMNQLQVGLYLNFGESRKHIMVETGV